MNRIKSREKKERDQTEEKFQKERKRKRCEGREYTVGHVRDERVETREIDKALLSRAKPLYQKVGRIMNESGVVVEIACSELLLIGRDR